VSVKVTTLYLKDLLSFKSKYTLVYIELLDVAWNSRCQGIQFSERSTTGLGWVGQWVGFAAVGPAGRRYRSIAAAAAGECRQCHVVSVRSS